MVVRRDGLNGVMSMLPRSIEATFAPFVVLPDHDRAHRLQRLVDVRVVVGRFPIR